MLIRRHRVRRRTVNRHKIQACYRRLSYGAILNDLGENLIKAHSGGKAIEHLATSDPANPGTLLEFYNIFQQRDYWRRWLPLKSTDPLLRRWTDEVLPKTNYLSPGSDNVSLGGYVGSKFQGFVFDPRLRNIFAQKHSTISLRDIIAQNKILLVNLAKGQLTETNSRFMGMLLLASLQNAILARVNVRESDRMPFFLCVDEFQSVATQSFVSLISEGRKFGLGLVLANQFISQIGSARITDSILGNVGTFIAFRLGPADAELIEQEMLPEVSRAALINLPNRRAYLKALINGEPARPIAIETILPRTPYLCGTVDRITNMSRQTFGRPRCEVEEQIVLSLKDR